MGTVFVCARQPQRPVSRALAPLIRLSALVQRRPRHRHQSHPRGVSAGRMTRLSSGGRIDRTRPLAFQFNGADYQGFAGETLASALLANGVRVVAHSAELGRPRGVYAMGAEEPNAYEPLAHEPLMRATQIDLVDGLQDSASHGKGRVPLYHVSGR